MKMTVETCINGWEYFCTGSIGSVGRLDKQIEDNQLILLEPNWTE